MSQNISQYIQQQMEAAQAKHAREAEELRKASEAAALRQKQEMIEKTLRCLALIGIEVSAEDLEEDDDKSFAFITNGFRFYSFAVEEFDQGGSRFSSLSKPASCFTRLSFRISRQVPDEVEREYLEIIEQGIIGHHYFGAYEEEYGFYSRELNGGVSIEANSEAEVDLKCFPEEKLTAIFDELARIERKYQSAYEAHKVWMDNARAQIAKDKTATEISPNALSKATRFSYTGDSREEILAAVLEDIRLAHLPEVEF